MRPIIIFRRFLALWVSISFLGTSIFLPPAHAQSVDISGLSFFLPKPGTRVSLSPAFKPVLIKGLKVHPENPFMFDFIVDPGDERLSADNFKKVSQRMVNYFLASLATPEKDLWVNLSPVEKNHIIPDTLIKTELGRDLLAEDYMLKQITASLIYPESNLGKTFWNKVYTQAYRKFGVTQVPVNVFNKVWILPEKASVFEKGNTVYIVNAHLKVMLEEDYLALNKLGENINAQKNNTVRNLSKQVLREVVLPAIENEVNEGKNFAPLRQILYALILAQWYQDVFKKSVLNKVYSGRNKVAGIDLSDPKNKDRIYHQYLSAYKKGVFSYIKEEMTRSGQQPVPRKYFSGGFVDQQILREPAMVTSLDVLGDEQIYDMRVDIRSVTSSEPPKALYHGKRLRIINGPEGVIANLQNPEGSGVVTDVTLEAFLSAIKGTAQLALGKGGLGFLAGETYQAYSELLPNWNAAGAMPLYSYDKNGVEVDWDHQEGVHPVIVQDGKGNNHALSIDVDFKGKKERAYIYWVDANGTPVFGIKQRNLFKRLYPGGDEQVIQYGFMGKAYVELCYALGIAPRILRLSEPQLIFVMTAVLNDIDAKRQKGERSIFAETKFLMTTHTPEAAALPVWKDVGKLKDLVGADLVRDDIIYNGQVNAAGAMGHHAHMINGVSLEHADVTREAVLPGFADKTTGIQNGSLPSLWRSDDLNRLISRKGIANITGKDLFDIGSNQKYKLNEYLRGMGLEGFADIHKRPLFGAVRRMVEYKSQALFIPMVRWIVGDPNKVYDSPLGPRKGLGANLLLAGEALDGVAPEWVSALTQLSLEPDIKGKFVIIERTTGTEFMKFATSATDCWLVMPWLTREASGTSDERAALNGHPSIATATGGPLEWIKPGVSGWLVNPFDFEHAKRNGEHSAEFRRIIWAFQHKEQWALTRFYEEGRRQFAAYMQEFVDMYRNPGNGQRYQVMEEAFRAAHQKVSIYRMINEYGIAFDVLNGGSANPIAEFEKRRAHFEEQWDKEENWEHEPPPIEIKAGETPPLSIDRDEALYLLNEIGGPFVWKDNKGEEVYKNGNGLSPFLEAFGDITPLEFHNRPGSADILSHLNYLYGESPVLAPLKESLREELNALKQEPETRGKIKLTKRAMDKLFDFVQELEKVEKTGQSLVVGVSDTAMNIPGGIKLSNIPMDRQGRVMTDVVSDKALEDMVLNSRGLRGVIVGITPIADLLNFIQ